MVCRLQPGFQTTNISWGQGQLYLKSTARILITRVFIFSIIFAYRVLITTKVSKYKYDLRVKRQGKIFLKYILRLVTRTPLSFFIKSVYIWYNACLLYVHYNGSSWSQNQGQICLKSNLCLNLCANSSLIFYDGCSYLTQ